jgi:hypothetical protein
MCRGLRDSPSKATFYPLFTTEMLTFEIYLCRGKKGEEMYETLMLALCVAGLPLWIVLEYRWRKKDWEAREKAALKVGCAQIRKSLGQVGTARSKLIKEECRR